MFDVNMHSLTMGLNRKSFHLHDSRFSKNFAGSLTLNLRGYGWATTAEFWRKLTFLALILPRLALMSTRTGSNKWLGEATSTIYEPDGTSLMMNEPSALRKPIYSPPFARILVWLVHSKMNVKYLIPKWL